MALAALAAALAPSEGAAEPRAGAPIVFARKQPAPQPASFSAATPRRVAALRPAASSRAAAPAIDARELLYGYGRRSEGPRTPLDLRGTFAQTASLDALPLDALDGALPEETDAASARAPATAPSRPAWLEQERTGAPYRAAGQWYVPAAEPNYAETGQASWYGGEFHGRRTASGEVFDAEALTAAHPTLPIPSLVQVTNLDNGREVIVRVNDRGPFHGGRLIDVSRRTAEALGFERQGSARVHVRYLGPAPKRVNSEGVDTPSPAPASPAPAVAVQGGYVVQVGAFSDPANVARARATLEPTGEVTVEARGGALQRVRVGTWTTREDAESARAKVASLGYRDAIVALR